MKSILDQCHPVVSLAYFALTLFFAMAIMHPAALVISLAGALAWGGRLGGRAALGRSLRYMLPLLLLTALINPAFSHRGVTILAYLPSGNPLTLESILYGVAAGIMLAAVLCWFSCLNRVLSSDKFVYLFGRAVPALSLVLSMALRFVPRFGRQVRAVTAAQQGIGNDASTGRLARRARHGVRVLSIVVTWALESAIDTADSMRSRGYGLPGRTAFSIYRWEERDCGLLALILGLGGYIAAMWARGGLYYAYYPTLRLAPPDAWSISALVAYGALCALPVVLDTLEARKWRRIEAAIQTAPAEPER